MRLYKWVIKGPKRTWKKKQNEESFSPAELEQPFDRAHIVQRLKGGDYHLNGEFTGSTFSSSLFGVDFESGC